MPKNQQNNENRIPQDATPKYVPRFEKAASGEKQQTNASVQPDKGLKFLSKKNSGGGAEMAVLGVGMIGLIGAYAVYKKMSGRSEAKDTGGLATKPEALEAYGYSYGRGGYLLGKYLKTEENPLKKLIDFEKDNDSTLWLKLEDRFRMTKIQASTGSGKTTQFIVPQLLEDAKSGIFNAFVVDRKPPELSAMTRGAWRKYNHRVIDFNPWIPEICWGFEPLFGATADEIEAMVEVMIPISHVEDSTWLYRNMDRHVIRTLFRAAQIFGKTDRQLATLPGIAELLNKGYLVCREAIEATKDRKLIDGISNLWLLPQSDLGRMFQGLAGRFSFLIEDENVARAFSRSDFTMKDIVQPADENPVNRTILYVGASQSKGDRSRKIVSLLTRLATIEAFRRGDEMRSKNLEWKDVVPLWMCLDERGTYSIPEDDDSMATFRSLGIAVTIALQSENQLIKWQGREAAATSDINFNFYVVLGGCDLEYAQRVSEEIGKHWVWTRSETRSRSYESFDFGKKKTEGEGWRKVEEYVLKPNEIMQLPDDEALIIGRKTVSTGRKCPPVRVKLFAFYKADEMSAAVNQSKDQFQRQYEINCQLDKNNRDREDDQPKRLPLPVFDWNRYLAIDRKKSAA